jgi:hypothetical protein
VPTRDAMPNSCVAVLAIVQGRHAPRSTAPEEGSVTARSNCDAQRGVSSTYLAAELGP